MLEICPTSNLLTGALASVEALVDTLGAFIDRGVQITIATDGPEMMRPHLQGELLVLRELVLSESDARRVNARGHSASRL